MAENYDNANHCVLFMVVQAKNINAIPTEEYQHNY